MYDVFFRGVEVLQESQGVWVHQEDRYEWITEIRHVNLWLLAGIALLFESSLKLINQDSYTRREITDLQAINYENLSLYSQLMILP